MTLLKEPLNSFLRRALRYGKITSLFLLPILFFGSLVLWLASSRAENEMRRGFLAQARFIVDSISGESLSSLSGSSQDLSSPLYRSLKRQLMDIRSVASECRFLYIMGRKQDGRLFYYADSEPQESKDYSPPGQIYPNAEFDLISTFRKGEEAILGPGSDAWGTWVSVLVPIRNLKTGKIIAFLGMDVDARLWKRTALFKGIVPTGGALILGIGLLALFLVHRGERSLRTPLFLRILPLLAILCFLVLTACALILWKVQDRRLDEITTGKVAERSMVWLLRQKESSPQALFKEKLIVAADQEFSPFTFLRGKALPAGHDIDVMNLLAKRMGIDVEYHLLPWQEAKRELLEKRADILLTLYYSDKRTEEYGMTTPVWQESFALFSNGSRRFQGFGDLRRGRLGTLQEGVVGPLFIQPLGLTKSTSFFPTFLDAFLALEKKRVDFVLAPYSVGIETLTKEKIKNVAVVGPPLLSSASCFAVRKEETSLLVLLNKHLEEMKNDGTLQRIHQRWNFHSRKELKDVSPWLRVVLLSLLAILLLSALLSIWVITLRREVKRTTGELQERQQYLSATLHSIIDGVISTDSSGRITDINGVAEALTGWRSGEALGHPLDEVFRCSTFTVSIEEKSPLFQMLHRRGFINHETPTVLLSKEGRERLITESRSSIHDTTGAPVGTVVVFRDVTEDYLQREELRESEERHRLVEENMPGAIAILNLEERQRFTYVSPSILALKGFTTEEVLSKPLSQLVTPESLHRLIRVYQENMAAEASRGGSAPANSYVVELKEFKKDGTLVWIEDRMSLLKDREGNPYGIISVLQDITERKNAEEALRINEEKYRMLLEFAADAFFHCDSAGNLLTVNNKAVELMGYTKEELLEMSFHRLFSEDSLTRNPFSYETLTDGGNLKEEREITRKDGRTVPVEMNSKLMPDGTYQSFFRDITQRKTAEEERDRLQEQLAQALRMESIGRLAGGVAHDFNNMLGAILGFSDLALAQADPTKPLSRYLKEIQRAAERSANLTKQLLAFARKQTVAPKLMDLNEAIEGMLKMLRRLIGEHIDLAWLPGASLWLVEIDPSQVDQLLANLCVNARDAIAGVGKITIETENTALDETYCQNSPGMTPGEYVLLAVSDDGCGMDKATIERIFEPFYTTKELGLGTGLGLSTVYGIVKQNNGLVNVYSEPGQGSTFKIYLPRQTGTPEEHSSEEEERIPAGQGESVLVVEDEPAILEMAKNMLVLLGYTVLTAKTPSEAIELAEARKEEISLLITDVVMPEMNGRELAEAMQRINPGIKFLFMSGYTADVIAHRGVLNEGVHFIPKPFSIKELGLKVRDILLRPPLQRLDR